MRPCQSLLPRRRTPRPNDLFRGSQYDESTVGFVTSAACWERVQFDQLMLQPAHVCVLRRELDVVTGSLHLLDPLEHILHRRLGVLGRVGRRVNAVDTRERSLDLRDRVAAQHMDRNARRLGSAYRRIVAPVVVLQSEHEVGVVDVVLDADWEAHLAKRLLEIAARDSIGKDRERGARTNSGSRRFPLPLTPLLSGNVLVDVEAATALAGAPPTASTAREGRGLEGRWPGRGGARVDATDDRAGVIAGPELRRANSAPQRLVNSLGERCVYDDSVALLD